MKFRQKSKHGLTLNLFGQEIPYDILTVIPFDSERKRMSVVAKNRETQEIQLFVKGADNQMFKIQEQSDEQQQLFYTIKQRVKEYGTDGLRTLVFGRKTLPADEYWRWQNRMDALKESRHLRDTEQEETDLAAELEDGVQLLGCSGVEDKL